MTPQKTAQPDLIPVAFVPCTDYTLPRLADATQQALAALNLSVTLCSADVLLKPNLISAKHGQLPCTQGALISAAARWLLDHGAKVSIGAHPDFDSALSVLESIGHEDELTALGFQVIDFSKGLKNDLPGGGSAVLAEAALDCDLLVNLPRVKAHAQTRLTLAVKNCFGCLVGLRKAWWHMAYAINDVFFDRVVRIPSVLPDSVILADGITAMHNTGPINGEPYPLSLLAASTDPVALDRALHEVLVVDPERSPLMSACRRAGMPAAELSRLSFPLTAPQEVQITDFLVPEELNPVRFNPFSFLKSTVRRMFLASQR